MSAPQAPFVRGDVVRSAILGALGRVQRAGRSTATIKWANGTKSQVMQQCSVHLVERLDPASSYGRSCAAYVESCIGPLPRARRKGAA